MGGSSDSGAREAEEERQKAIKQGTDIVNKTFASFTPEFYQQRQQAFLDWASPQLNDQYEQAQKDLTYALARQYGTLDTSIAADRQAKLAAQRALAESQISSQAIDYETQSREAIENQRNALLMQVQGGADPATAANLALKQSELLSAPQTYAALGDLFSNVTEGLASANYPYGIWGQPPTTGYGKGGATKPGGDASRIVNT